MVIIHFPKCLHYNLSRESFRIGAYRETYTPAWKKWQNWLINISVRLRYLHLESKTTQFFSEASCGIAAIDSPAAQKGIFLPACHYVKDVWQDVLSNKMWIMTFSIQNFWWEEWVLKPRNLLAFLQPQFPSFQRLFQCLFGEMHEIRTVVKARIRDFHKIYR